MLAERIADRDSGTSEKRTETATEEEAADQGDRSAQTRLDELFPRCFPCLHRVGERGGCRLSRVGHGVAKRRFPSKKMDVETDTSRTRDRLFTV